MIWHDKCNESSTILRVVDKVIKNDPEHYFCPQSYVGLRLVEVGPFSIGTKIDITFKNISTVQKLMKIQNSQLNVFTKVDTEKSDIKQLRGT